MLHAAGAIELPGPNDFVGDCGAPDDHEPRTPAHVRWLILHGNGYERQKSFLDLKWIGVRPGSRAGARGTG